HVRLEQRQYGPLRLHDDFSGRCESAGDQDARKVESERQPQRLDPRRRLEALEIANLALAENQHAARAEVLVEARERQTGLLDIGAGDAAFEASRPCEKLEREPEALRPAAEEGPDGDGWRGRHVASDFRSGRLQPAAIVRLKTDATVLGRILRFSFH